uniref:reverse transcriptase domain-containing protein n=1 Tax=Acinetobacter baumannii TaxID=470 RepID=UPI003393167C
KQGCVFAPTLFGIFFSMLLRDAFKDCEEGVYIHRRADGGLFNITRVRAKTKRTNVLLRELLFADDDDALVSHTEDGLQQLITRLSDACKEFGLAISLKKTNVMVQGFTGPPNLKVDDYTLEPVSDFNYLGSTVSNSV